MVEKTGFEPVISCLAVIEIGGAQVLDPFCQSFFMEQYLVYADQQLIVPI